VALLGSLLAAMLYAAFAHGATGSSAEARVQVALAAVGALAGATWLWNGQLRFSAPRRTLAGITLLAAFAAWSALTLLWSVAPEQTWIEFNRVLGYLLMLCLAVMFGASHPRSLELLARGFLAIVLAVTLYALGQKVLPGLHLGGVFDLNQTGPLSRLQEPFGYWNALALFIAMGVPFALVGAIDRSRTVGARVAALLAMQLMLLTIGLTYSRGGLLALGLALLIGLPLSRAPLRALLWLGVACLAATPPLIVGLTSHSLSAPDVSLADREAGGLVLAAVLLVALLVTVVVARRLLRLEQDTRLSPDLTRTIRRGVFAAAAALLFAALAITALSSRGLGGTASHAWRSFTTTRSTSISDPRHLLSVDSENRWVWWKEAAGAASDRPFTGWGAGAFPVVHLLYRRDALTVRQPHSVPLQWLAETGVIGTALALLALVALLSSALSVVRRWPPGSARLLGSAMLTAAVVYAIHALYDWDWDIPGVTLPALLLLGVLAGSASRTRESGTPLLATETLRPATLMSAVRVGFLTLFLSLFALSVLLPRLAADKVSAAEVAGESGSSEALSRASATAAFASRLDPLSDGGLLAQATIALHRRQQSQARRFLFAALQRDPSDVQAWESLVGIDLLLGYAAAAKADIGHVVALDPRARFGLIGIGAQHLALNEARPRRSPTAAPLPTTLHPGLIQRLGSVSTRAGPHVIPATLTWSSGSTQRARSRSR
jgi:hypothetical protein